MEGCANSRFSTLRFRRRFRIIFGRIWGANVDAQTFQNRALDALGASWGPRVCLSGGLLGASCGHLGGLLGCPGASSNVLELSVFHTICHGIPWQIVFGPVCHGIPWQMRVRPYRNIMFTSLPWKQLPPWTAMGSPWQTFQKSLVFSF